MIESIAIVGATGAVGTIILQLLEERKFPYQRIKFLASGRSAGKQITFRGQQHTVEKLEPDAFNGIDLAIGSTPDEVAKEFVPGPWSAAASWSMKAATGAWTPTCRWSSPK